MSRITLNKIRSQLSTSERILSWVIHKSIIGLVLALLEKSFFRTTSMYFGFVAAIIVGGLVLVTVYFFGYQIVSMTTLGYVFIVGFIVGSIYEYVRSMVGQVK